jgi:methyl-accepting chemotaxis protein
MKTILSRIASLTVGTKIAAIMALLLLPLGHMTTLFLQRVTKDIAFSSLELDGARLLPEIWTALATSASPNVKPDAVKAAAARVGGTGEAATRFKAGEAVAAFASALAAASGEAAWDAGEKAIQKIADGSNLTLDPDVDSYYMMDVTTVRLPELVSARAQLHLALEPFAMGRGNASFQAHDGLVQAATRYEIARAAVRHSLELGLAGNADGSVRKALAPIIQKLDSSSTRLSELASSQRAAIAQGKPPVQADADFDAVMLAQAGSTDELWRASQQELTRLIGARVDGMKSTALRELLLSGLATLFAVGVALAFVRSIRNPINDIIATLRRFQSNDYSGVVPHVGLRNEIGEIARAVDRGKAEAERVALTVAAMNQSPTMLMITGPDGRIYFVSAALQALLTHLEPAFRSGGIDFSVDKMVGQPIDYYRANPNLRRQVLADHGRAQKLRHEIGDQTILVDAAEIRAPDGSVVGQTLIWRNVTAELLGESEVAAVVGAAQRGDFSARLTLDGKDGFVGEVATGLNNVSALVEGAMTEFAAVMDALARADLTRTVKGDYLGVLGTLKDGINATIERLATTVRTIQATSADVGVAAREINTGADDLSKRTEEQASSLEETAATTEELAASVKASAQGARQAAAIAEEAMQAAQTGGAIAGEAVSAMARIEGASKKISDITRVIDDIAFQTNLLALNAAVEAARAGDAGKGFAVVASEVRTLAQRSGEAARDISSLISSSNNEVEAGVRLVRQAGDALEKILSASQRVTSTIQEISAAAGEQANGISEMSQAVAHLDEMTQANAALAEQSAASAGALSGRIGELNALVATFRSEDSQSPGEDSERRLVSPAPGGTLATLNPVRRDKRLADSPRAQPAKRVVNARGGRGWDEF